MILAKKTAATAGIVLAAVVCVAVHSSVRLTEKARRPGLEPEAKLRALRTAEKLFPWNETSFEEKGLILLERAAENLGDVENARRDVSEAWASLRRALRLNPGSAAVHLYYAKTLDLMRYVDSTRGESPFREYEKAAQLAGPDRNLIRDIGVVLFGRWTTLTAEEQGFTEGLLKQSLQPGDVARFQEVLHVWDLNIREDGVMQKIIPESPALMRIYAQFLAEKNMPLEARHRTLARAERLEYEQAWKSYEAGQNEFKMGEPPKAAQHFAACLDTLKKIRFYGQILGHEKIGAEVEKKATLMRTSYLDLAKARLEETRDLAQAQESLRAYLALEDNYNQVTELEHYLKSLRIIPESESDLPVKNIRQLSFRVLLMFKLHRYRQIISLGGQLQQSLLPSDPAVRKDLSEIFQMVGDSYMKLDFVYESEGLYQKALELQPGSPEVLFRMKKYYERRNETERILEVDRLLAKVLSAGDLLAKPVILAKGEAFKQVLLMNVSQKRVRVSFKVEAVAGNEKPLVSVCLNDRVYWEDYPQGQEVSLELEVAEGFNSLDISAVNGPAALVKVTAAALAPESPFEGGGQKKP